MCPRGADHETPTVRRRDVTDNAAPESGEVSNTIKRGTIDQRAVVDAATAVARRVGLAWMTMRMVADELGVSAMAAYRHVPNRDAWWASWPTN